MYRKVHISSCEEEWAWETETPDKGEFDSQLSRSFYEDSLFFFFVHPLRTRRLVRGKFSCFDDFPRQNRKIFYQHRHMAHIEGYSMDDGGDQGKRRPRTVRYKAINKNIFAFSLTRAVVKNHPKIHNPRGENERRAKKKIVAIKNLSNFAIKTYKDPHSLSHFVASGNFLFVKNSSWGRQAQKSTRNVSFIPVIFLRKSHDKFQKDKIISHKIYFMLYYEIV